MNTKIYTDGKWVELGSNISIAIASSEPDETSKTINVKKVEIGSVNKDDVVISDQEQVVLYDFNVSPLEV